MKEPKRYSCGNGEGMFEDDKNGDWVEYSEHKAIVEALTEQLRIQTVVEQSEQLKCGKCSSDWEQKLIGKNIHSVFTWCKDCHSEGVNIPLNDECGNCGSKNTVRYYDKETIDLLF